MGVTARALHEPQGDLELELSARDERKGWVVRLHPQTGARHLDELEFGLLPHNTGSPTTAPRPRNARAETVAELPMFADAFQRRRAIVPVDVYFQRRSIGSPPQRFAISRANGQTMAFAGLWESYRWPNGLITRTYCIITTAANAMISEFHDRMPVILEKADCPIWLGERPGDPSSLLRPASPGLLQCRQVGGRKGRAR
ncbi:hypothetical protein GCM10011611_24860 [Aliidongia dinghuensis]|uniref:Abasic site processing protein n=1 Tax=Aliidongia dinghuensis TaxID=1867774 RepID=A0A8J3E3E8_9PROT|nr:SOS response-associated peptidase [Aliidongia dinghuensis]GGF18049.1 hypothetical protein GCM10011611_24860 [Aliidongia dinghuensis]